MPIPLFVASIIGIAVIAFAVRCVISARRSSLAKRSIAALVFVAIGLFCAWGFVAAAEPGEFHFAWRVGYGVVFVTCLFTTGWLIFAKRLTDDTNHNQAPTLT